MHYTSYFDRVLWVALNFCFAVYCVCLCVMFFFSNIVWNCEFACVCHKANKTLFQMYPVSASVQCTVVLGTGVLCLVFRYRHCGQHQNILRCTRDQRTEKWVIHICSIRSLYESKCYIYVIEMDTVEKVARINRVHKTLLYIISRAAATAPYKITI